MNKIATLIEHGKNIKLSFTLPNKKKLSFRPLSDWEFDKIDLMLYEKIDDRNTLEYFYKLRSALEPIPEKMPENIKIPILQNISKERIYWIALASIHDFYDDLDFDDNGLEKIKKITGIKSLVSEILKTSGRTRETEDEVKKFRGNEELSASKT